MKLAFLLASLCLLSPLSLRAAETEVIQARMRLTLMEITGTHFQETRVCSGVVTIPLIDVRRSAPKNQNGMPTLTFDNCQISRNDKTLIAKAWIGAGLLRGDWRGTQVEDNRATEVAVMVGDQSQTMWVTEADIARKDKTLTLDFSVPHELRVAGNRQWFRASIDFYESDTK